MPLLKIEPDGETYERLVEQAAAERRPIVWQAEVTLRRALGLPFPYQTPPATFTPGPGNDAA
jgi:hypothetical protein